jgi:dTDP-4-dehydrorhamnose reductase
MRILLIGKNGQVGWELNSKLHRFANLLAVGRQELDLLNTREAVEFINRAKPEIIINATGYNDVDGAERDQVLAKAINVNTNALIAKIAAQIDAFYITYSSDYVFDGRKGVPYTEMDQTNPINYYGKSKLEGENAVQESGAAYLILRTSSIFSLRRPCFVTKIIEKAQRQPEIRVRSDLISSPTSASFLSEATIHILENFSQVLEQHVGLFHVAGSGFGSRFEWAETIKNYLGLNTKVYPIIDNDISDVSRPTFSALNSQHFEETFHLSIPSWKVLLGSALKEIV